jgi:hypothetical protein
MWIVFTVLGVFVGGGAALGTTVLIRNKRKRIKARRKVRKGLGKLAVAGVNKQRVRNRKKRANRAGWKAGVKAAFPWLVAAGRAGSSAFRDAKGDVLHANQRIRTAGHAKSGKPGPYTKTTPKPGQGQPRQTHDGPKQLERHSVVLNGKGQTQGQGGGSGHLCGARLKADPKRSCHNPVDCPNHGPRCTEVIRCHFHRGAFGGSGGGPRPQARPMPQGQPPRPWKVGSGPSAGQPQGHRPGQPHGSGQQGHANTASGQDNVPFQVGQFGGGGGQPPPKMPKPDQGGSATYTNNVSDQARVGSQNNEIHGDVYFDSKGKPWPRRMPR